MGATTSAPSTPKVTGPIEGGAHGWPFGASLVDLTDRGWVEEEYFVEGDATAYEPDGPLDDDGRWTLRPREQMPFRTRILVRRPLDPAQFSGTVLVSWANVTVGFEILTGVGDHLIDAGIASVSVSAQAVGLHGFAGATTNMGMVAWDPERYGTLSVPSDDISYDIFSQVGRLLRSGGEHDGPHPLAGLAVERIIAEGASQSAMRVHSYVNGVHPLAQVFDGYYLLVQRGFTMPFVTAGGVPAAFAGVATGAGSKPAPRGGSEAPRAGVRVREDLDVPVFVVNSEGEVPGFLPIRPADGRAGSVLLWEMAGTSHGGGVLSDMEDKFARDFGIPFEGLAGNQPAPEVEPNAVDWSGVSQAAMLHLDRWIATGEEPPRVPLLETEGNPPQIARDEHGNARGGVRLPPVDVPIATVTGWGDGPHFVAIAGTNVPFSAEKLRALYPDHDTYVACVRAAAEAEVAAGTLHPSAVQRFVDEAAQAAVPPPA